MLIIESKTRIIKTLLCCSILILLSSEGDDWGADVLVGEDGEVKGE